MLRLGATDSADWGAAASLRPSAYAAAPANLAMRRWSDRYLLLLAAILTGYALLGKGFAYLGVPPLYVGEIAGIAGVVLLLRSGRYLALLTTVPAMLVAATMVWVALRTIPYLRLYGFDALRDSVVVTYGVFSFVLIGLLLEDIRRVGILLSWYDRFLDISGPAIPIIFAICWYLDDYLPRWPVGTIPIIDIRPGEAAVHMTGAAVFAVVGLRNAKLAWAVPVAAGLVTVGTLSRGPLLAEAIPIVAAVVAMGKLRQLCFAVVLGVGIFSAAYALEPLFFHYVEPKSSEDRPISTRQLANNLLTMVGQSDEQGESTETWRLKWWNIILEETLHGPDFWRGRGFGLNIAEADGFGGRVISRSPPLRSPHNIFMTLLARAGVPGVAIWSTLVVSWFIMIGRAIWQARRSGDRRWLATFVFIGCYVMSITIDASFDVALEGPMLGIWFWCLMGFGIGSVMVFRGSLRATRAGGAS